MSRMTVKFKGLDKLIREMSEVTKAEFESEVKEAVRRNGAEMQQKAQRLVPVDTGNLKRSITLSVVDGGLTAEVETTANYATFVEYGTRFMGAQPYMRPSFDQQEPTFNEDMERLAKKYTK